LDLFLYLYLLLLDEEESY